MKIIPNSDEVQDLAGRFPVCKVEGAELAKIYDWLFWQYGSDGYKFAIVFDLTEGEYSVPENPKNYTENVYFLDELFEEIVSYMGVEWCVEALKKYKH